MLHELTQEEQREYQFHRLQQFLRHAHHVVPYWKHIKRSLTRRTTFDIKEFERLPILTREKLIKYGDEFVVKNIKQHKFRVFATSGSTGIPKKYFAKKVYFQKMMAAEEFYVNFCGLKDFKQHGYATTKPHLKDLVTYLTPGLNMNNLQKALDKILTIGGTLNRLISLAEKIEDKKIHFKPKFALSGSEFLTTTHKKYLEKIFQCPVYNKYVCAEVGILGLECPELGGFHIDPVGCYVEIVDDNGRSTENGASGRIVITPFNNRLMPLIRYDIGDIGGWISGECTCCGLNTPRLFFEGRKLNYIKLAHGKKVAAIGIIRSIDNEFANVIAKQQIIQESVNKILLKFVPGPGYRPFHDKLIFNFFQYFFKNSPEVLVEVIIVPSLNNFKNGKHVIFESLVGDELNT